MENFVPSHFHLKHNQPYILQCLIERNVTDGEERKDEFSTKFCWKAFDIFKNRLAVTDSSNIPTFLLVAFQGTNLNQKLFSRLHTQRRTEISRRGTG